MANQNDATSGSNAKLSIQNNPWYAEQQEQKENSKHTTPSPFNISKGPRPPGWFSN